MYRKFHPRRARGRAAGGLRWPGPDTRIRRWSPGAIALMDAQVVACAGATRVARALERARAAGARVVVAGPRQAVRTAELARAVDWGLGPRPVREVAWRELPVLPADASEIEVRRRALGGRSLVLLRRAGRIAGAVDGETVDLLHAESSLLSHLERSADRRAEARLWLLARPGRSARAWARRSTRWAGSCGTCSWAVDAPDVDLVVEGDGIAFARRLGEEIGGRCWCTAHSGPRRSRAARARGRRCDGAPLGRVDVASTRRERYAPGGRAARCVAHRASWRISGVGTSR